MPSNRPRPNFPKSTGRREDGFKVQERPANLIPNVRLNTASDILTYLKDHFRPQCIGVNEREVDAHRRAGEVGLAQRLIATIEYSQEHQGEEDLED